MTVLPFPHFDNLQDHAVPENPDPEKLQKLLSQLVEATSSLSSSTPPPRDREIPVRNFRSDRYELTEALIVVMEERDGQYIANSYDTGQYGHGYSPDDAIQHLCSVLEDYYELLSDEEGRLSEGLRSHLRYLRSILRIRE